MFRVFRDSACISEYFTYSYYVYIIRLGKPKTVTSEAGVKANETERASSSQRVKGEFSILQSCEVRHFHDFGKNIRSYRIVPHVTKILQNFWLTLVFPFQSILVDSIHLGLCTISFFFFCFVIFSSSVNILHKMIFSRFDQKVNEKYLNADWDSFTRFNLNSIFLLLRKFPEQVDDFLQLTDYSSKIELIKLQGQF